MEEILITYQGIIGAIGGTVLGTVATLITTHFLRNSGKVKTTVFNVDFDTSEPDPFQSHNRLDFKVKFYNTSESIKVLDNVKVVFLDDKNKVLYETAPNDRDTFRSTQFSATSDLMYFVNLQPKQLTLKKLYVILTSQDVADVGKVKTIKFSYAGKRKKEHVIYRK